MVAGIFVGRSLLDDYILHLAKTGISALSERVIEELALAGAGWPGFVLYPLTRFGMMRPGLFEDAATLKTIAVFRSAGFAVGAQTHDLEQAHMQVASMARALGVGQKLSRSDLDHFARTARWIPGNPLMLVRLISHTGDMYENQFVYTLKIRIAASLVVMMHALSADAGKVVERHRSTAFVNNFETLDIGHYLIAEGSPKKGNSLSVRRVPMNVAPLDLARLSDVAVTLSTDTLASSPMRRHLRALVPALRAVERGYLEHVNLKSTSKVRARVFKRLVTALDWYRQSFGSRTNEAEAVVALAVAFETLLTDSYGKGVADRISRRVGLCLKGAPGVARHRDAVLAIYYARSEIVHTGSLGQAANIVVAQAVFARCFHAIAGRLSLLADGSAEPIRDLLGDA